jgi:hypothetical protein
MSNWQLRRVIEGIFTLRGGFTNLFFLQEVKYNSPTLQEDKNLFTLDNKILKLLTIVKSV